MFRGLNVTRVLRSSAQPAATSGADAVKRQVLELAGTLGVSARSAARFLGHRNAALAITPQRGGGPPRIDRDIAYLTRCNKEIRAIFGWSETQNVIAGAKGAPVDGSLSAAELIQLTAFSEAVPVGAGGDDTLHEPGCPVGNGSVALTRIVDEAGATAAVPCKHCIRRRLNHLASEHFGYTMSWNSVAAHAEGAKVAPSSRLISMINDAFGSVDIMKETLHEFAVNRRDAGFTWLVFNPAYKRVPGGSRATLSPAEEALLPPVGRLEVVNLPHATVPVVVGMWPLACVNVSTGVVMDGFFADKDAVKIIEHAEPPVWSRAARNPASAAGRVAAEPTAEDLVLAKLRSKTARQQLAQLNLRFIGEQAEEAYMFFASSEFAEQRAARAAALDTAAREAIMKSFDAVEMEKVVKRLRDEHTQKAAASAPAASTSASTTAQTAATPQTTTQTTTQAAAAAPAQEVPSTPAPAAAEEDAVVAQGLCEDGTTQYFTRASGVTSYRYEDGRVTDVHPDGTQITYSTDLTTTVRPDGTLHYLYANGATIEIRPDGSRYVNGVLEQQQ